MRSTPHDYYLEFLEQSLREVPYTEDEIGRILRATGIAWECLFRGKLVEEDPDPTDWEADALGLIFEGIRKAIDKHPLSEFERKRSKEPAFRVLRGGKKS